MAHEDTFSQTDIAEAKQAFERMARRLDTLWNKPRLTPVEGREVQLILNNAIVAQEILEGKTPEEFKESPRKL